MSAVWCCDNCGRAQGDDIEKPCECGGTLWTTGVPHGVKYIIGMDPATDEEPEEPTALDVCPKPNTP